MHWISMTRKRRQLHSWMGAILGKLIERRKPFLPHAESECGGTHQKNKTSKKRRRKNWSWRRSIAKCHVYKTRFVAFFRTCLWWLYNIDAENVFSGANNEILQYPISYTRNTSVKIPMSLRYHIDNVQQLWQLRYTASKIVYLFGWTEDAIDRNSLQLFLFIFIGISRCFCLNWCQASLGVLLLPLVFEGFFFILFEWHTISRHKMIKKSWLLQFEIIV